MTESPKLNDEGVPIQSETLPQHVQELLLSLHRYPQDAREKFIKWRDANSEDNFEYAIFKSLDLAKMNFTELNLSHAQFFECNLSEAAFRNSKLYHGTFDTCILTQSKFSDANLVNVRIKGCQTGDADFHNAQLDGACFEGIFGLGSKFDNASCNHASFVRCQLMGATFTNCKLEFVKFDSSELHEAVFASSILDNATFTSTRFNRVTSFNRPRSITKCTIDRYALACLGPDVGNLTEGNLMDMEIVDHVAEMRLRFSGLFGLIHTLTIVAFFFPYAYFLIVQWGKTFLLRSSDNIYLFTALGNYIATGGHDWQDGERWSIISISAFILMCSYQVGRIVLLGKTKELEAQQAVKGLPAKFSLDDPSPGLRIYRTSIYCGRGFKWRWALNFINIVFIVAVASALWSVWNFAFLEIPIHAGRPAIPS